jgi:beta-glucosidase
MNLRTLVCFCALSALAWADDSAPAFRNPDLPFPSRVDDLVGRMTVPEKISQLLMASAAIPRLGIPAYHWWNEALHGFARHGIATVFPQAIGLAATWDPALHQRIADAISTEARAENNETLRRGNGDTRIYEGLTIWSPNINIFRDPRWGRGQETYGEDPFLTGRFAVAFVRGLQGGDAHYLKVVSTVKHFAVHSGPEELRHRFDAVISERDLHETYLPAFEAGIREGGAQSLMSAYNAIDGIPAPANRRLLTTILRGDWGFTGAVVGDVDTVRDLFDTGGHGYAKDAAEASADALKGGTDLCSGTTYEALPEALKRGLVTEADLDRALRRLFLLRFRLGQFDPAERVAYRQIPLSVVDSPAHDQLALEAARQSLVLLKNDGALPWSAGAIRTLAIIGPTGDDLSALVGNYNGTPAHPVTIVAGLRRRLEPRGVKVIYDPAVPIVVGLRENGQNFPAGVLFTDESRRTPGLAGQFFATADFAAAPAAARIDGQVDLAWNPAQLPAGIPPELHARWTGVLVPPATGEYALSVTFIGQARLFIDGRLVAGEANLRDRGQVRTRSERRTLTGGRAYQVSLEFNQTGSDGKIQLGWVAPGAIDAAVALARSADHILLTLGITPDLEGEEMPIAAEGFSHGDRTSVLLPQIQRELLDRIAALGKPFTVVFTGGSAVSFEVAKPNAALMAWYYGQRGGDAVAEALLGEINPAGRLPVTFYRSDADLPAFTNYAMAGRTYRYFNGAALFPFGHGLSYTRFAYGNLRLAGPRGSSADPIRFTVNVANTGSRDGDEVVQAYVRHLSSRVPQPIRSLVAFRRVPIAAGATASVALAFPAQALRQWDEGQQRYLVESGDYELEVGASSGDLRQRIPFAIP